MSKRFDLFGVIAPYEEAGYVSLNNVREFLDGVDDDEEIELYINSPGGSVFEALGIYNLLLERQEHLTVKIIGQAASAASFIACAGAPKRVWIAKTALMFLHEVIAMAWGNKSDLKKIYDDLETIEDSVIHSYTDKTGLSADEIREVLQEAKYLNADNCKKMGLVDRVWNPSKAEEANAAKVKNESFVLLNNAYNINQYINLFGSADTDEPKQVTEYGLTFEAAEGTTTKYYYGYPTPEDNEDDKYNDNKSLVKPDKGMKMPTITLEEALKETGALKTKTTELQTQNEKLTNNLQEITEAKQTLETDLQAQKDLVAKAQADLEAEHTANSTLLDKQSELEVDNFIAVNSQKITPVENSEENGWQLKQKLLALLRAGEDLKIGDKTMYQLECEVIESRKVNQGLDGKLDIKAPDGANYNADVGIKTEDDLVALNDDAEKLMKENPDMSYSTALKKLINQ